MTYTRQEIGLDTVADKQINRQRAAAVAAQMRRTGREHFDMRHWFVDPETVDEVLDLDAADAMTDHITDCGTTACFYGHSAIVAVQQGVSINDAPDVMDWLGLPNDSLAYLTSWNDAVMAIGGDEFDTILYVLDDVAQTGDWEPWTEQPPATYGRRDFF